MRALAVTLLIIISLASVFFITCTEAPYDPSADINIDYTGDINLDGLHYTIADAVMLSNYFVYGETAFVNITDRDKHGYVIGYDDSYSATDVNQDGIYAGVADLVFLIRVVVGDANYTDKVSPISVNINIGSSIAVDAHLGAAYVVLAGEQYPTLTAEMMEMKTKFDGENTHVLVWSQDGNIFQGEFLSNVGEVVSYELSSVVGSRVMTEIIPANFELGQNYPNPFNPSTYIEISLPVASEYTLTIKNVNGVIVETFSGTASAGFLTIEWDGTNHDSGVYFYRLTAGGYTAVKSMMLLH